MKTVVVALDKDMMSNFHHARAMWTRDGVRYVVHSDPQAAGDAIEEVANYDLYLRHIGEDSDKVKPMPNVFDLTRYSKKSQAQLVNAAVDSTRYPSFIKLATIDFSNQHAHRPFYRREKVVIKPMHGARSIGQFIVDGTKHCVETFCSRQRDRLVKIRQGDRKVLYDELLAELTGDGISFNRGRERDGGVEGLDCLDNQGICIQQYVPDIAAEYRLLTGYNGEIRYVYKRQRVEEVEGYAYADAAAEEERVELTDIKLNKRQLALLSKLAATVIGPMSSIDLFVTRNGNFGIFEFCVQFGTEYYDPIELRDYHEGFIEYLARQRKLT